MELFAIIVGICCLLFIVSGVAEGDNSFALFLGIIFLLSQLLWLPQVLDEKTTIETWTTDKYENIIFYEPMKITKTRIYKPGSCFSDDTKIKIERAE